MGQVRARLPQAHPSPRGRIVASCNVRGVAAFCVSSCRRVLLRACTVVQHVQARQPKEFAALASLPGTLQKVQDTPTARTSARCCACWAIVCRASHRA